MFDEAKARWQTVTDSSREECIIWIDLSIRPFAIEVVGKRERKKQRFLFQPPRFASFNNARGK